MESNNIMTEKQLDDMQMQCYRLEAVLKASQEALENEEMEQTKLLLQSGRILLWQMTNQVEEAVGFGSSDKPDDL